MTWHVRRGLLAGQGGGSAPDPFPDGTATGFRVGSNVLQFDADGLDDWDGRGRFGGRVGAGVYPAFAAGASLSVERVAEIGRSYGPHHLEAVGNDLGPTALAALSSGRVALVAGLAEGPEYVAAVNTDDTYHWVMSKNGVVGGNFGGVAAGVCSPAAGDRVAVLWSSGDITLVNAATGAVVANQVQSARAHPGGFPTAYNRQTIDMACAGTTLVVSYLDYDLVRVWTVDSDGDSLTWEQDFTVSNPAGVAVGTDGRPLVIEGVTYTKPTPAAGPPYNGPGAQPFNAQTILTTTAGRVLRLNANGTTTEVAASGFAANPWRLSVRQSNGDIAVASWQPDARIRVFDSSWVLQFTFGTSGGRANGTYVGTDFLNLHDLDWDSDGHLWVTEFQAAARVTRRINGSTGAVLRTLYGGQKYGTTSTPEGGDDPTRVWLHGRYGFCLYSFTPSTGAWAMLETYQFPDATRDLFYASEVKSVRFGGEVYLYTGVGFRLYHYDPTGKTVRLVTVVDRLDTSYWIPTAVRETVAAANPGSLYCLWTAPDDGTRSIDYTPTSGQFAAWTTTGSLFGLSCLEVGSDLSIYCPTRRPCRLPVSSVRADDVPLYNTAGRVDFPDLIFDADTYGDADALHPGSDGFVYQVVSRSYGGGGTGTGDGSGGWGEYYHGQQVGTCVLVKRRADGAVVWQTGLHESGWNLTAGRTHWLRTVLGVVNGVVFVGHAGDADGGGIALYDATAGLWLGDISTMAAADTTHPDFWKLRATVTDVPIGSVIADPDDADAVLVFGCGNSSAVVSRVLGVGGITRDSGHNTVAASSSTITADGTGLTFVAYNTTDLSGSPALTTTGNYRRLDDGGAALPGVTASVFSFTLEGTIKPTKTGPHRISSYPIVPLDDSGSVKVWVGGTLVSDTTARLGYLRRSSQQKLARSAPLLLTAGTPVTVRVEARGIPRTSGFIHSSSGSNRFLCVSWADDYRDERDVPVSLCYPSGTGSLSPGDYNRWVWPTPNTYPWVWPLTSYSAGSTASSTAGAPPLLGHGSVTALTDEDASPCIELVSTLNAPAILFTRRLPWPDNYDATDTGAWAFEFKIKTSVANESLGVAGMWRHGLYGVHDSFVFATLADGSVRWGNGGYDTVTGLSLNDGAWHTVRFDRGADGVSHLTTDGVLRDSFTFTPPTPMPHAIIVAPPVPTTSGVSHTWRVRDFKVWPQG